MSPALAQELEKGEHASVVAVFDALLKDAAQKGASDLHVDPAERGLRIRVRVDGELMDEDPLPLRLHAELIARIKVLAELRTDEHQRPQDGRLRFTPPEGSPLDVRVSTLPTYYGENAVLRLLSSEAETFTLPALGFSDAHIATLTSALARPSGMIVATGPTGSGKTTTLYALARLLNTPNRSVVTIEDPIEYSLPGIRQIEADHRTGLTFASGLRSILRQDPDILLVGEIRDSETARLAVNAALTGHLVLSTLHTNDAASALPRLLDLGIEPYLVAATLRLVISQRLARRICKTCRQEERATGDERQRLSELESAVSVPKVFFRGTGCESCAGSGYRGRVGLYEVLSLPESVREAWNARAPLSLRTLKERAGMEPLVVDGLRKASEGRTTLAEVLRLMHE